MKQFCLDLLPKQKNLTHWVTRWKILVWCSIKDYKSTNFLRLLYLLACVRLWMYANVLTSIHAFICMRPFVDVCDCLGSELCCWLMAMERSLVRRWNKYSCGSSYSNYVHFSNTLSDLYKDDRTKYSGNVSRDSILTHTKYNHININCR